MLRLQKTRRSTRKLHQEEKGAKVPKEEEGRSHAYLHPRSMIVHLSFRASFIMPEQIQHLHVTYNDIHNLIRKSTPKIVEEFNPDLLIAIGLFLLSII